MFYTTGQLFRTSYSQLMRQLEGIWYEVCVKRKHDQRGVVRIFNPTDAVLFVNPEVREQLGPGFASSYRVLRKVGEVNYIISTSDRRQRHGCVI